MKRIRYWRGTVLALVISVAAGCGRPTMPGSQFKGPEIPTSTETPSTSPLPKQAYVERGPADAKVRVVAFFYMDDTHKPLLDLLMGFVDQYQGKVYVKYVDPRTEEGQGIQGRSGMRTYGILINGTSDVTIQAKPAPYTISFVQEMGRYWTTDDLKAAVAQAVEEADAGRAAPEQWSR